MAICATPAVDAFKGWVRDNQFAPFAIAIVANELNSSATELHIFGHNLKSLRTKVYVHEWSLLPWQATNSQVRHRRRQEGKMNTSRARLHQALQRHIDQYRQTTTDGYSLQ